MIQENKFIFKFIYGVLIDELCESAQLITNQDLSKLAKSLENTHVKNINISPSLVDIPQSGDDIFIVLDDVQFVTNRYWKNKEPSKPEDSNMHEVRKIY